MGFFKNSVPVLTRALGFAALCFCLCLCPPLLKSAEATDSIAAVANLNGENLVVTYQSSGAYLREVGIDPKISDRVFSGRWSATSSIAALGKDGKTFKVRFVDNSGTIFNELAIPDGPLHSIIVADADNSGFDDLIAIRHVSGRAVATIFFNPGISSGAVRDVQLPAQATYYSAAINGNSAVGIFAYSPKGAVTAKAKKVSKRKKKANKNKKKKPSKKSGSARVELIGFGGNSITGFTVNKGPDGQIYPHSAFGGAGFALKDTSKIKFFDSTGKALKDVSVSAGVAPVMGDFSGRGVTGEMLLAEGGAVKIHDIASGSTRSIQLTGLPSKKDLIQAEIDRLRQELINRYRAGVPPSELLKLSDQILELERQKSSLNSANDLAGKQVRLFTGGAGAIEGVCDSVDDTPNDGYGGFLAKNGDFNSKAVFLTPGGKAYVNADLIKFKSYKVITKLKDSGYGNPDSGGFRKHFRATKPLSAYGKFIFRAQIKTGYASDSVEKHCWAIKNPSSRID